ncbi:HU family DNA-binding protein [Methylobacterium sp. 391_Methyba4]|uniref:HU family DNA-binding protein n=1 Tax=Methylobacterium sp. 391_Methyba4 TaxID=3038924 RepID=UPI00241C105A|nr:HU family DNA-binding protein [Methylobacterium sp. 391_Methyba4]WFS09693.1 HU family DNA-binding protein [Methylobacterium sp. 391_Methyba4]
MIRSELIARLAQQNPHLFAKEAEIVVDALIDRITAALAAGDRVDLRDFGTFSVRDHDGSTQAVAERTKLPQCPTGIHAVADHMVALIDSYAGYANAVREKIDETNQAGDPDSADLFTEISRAVDKHLWFLKADVQEPTGTLRDGNK